MEKKSGNICDLIPLTRRLVLASGPLTTTAERIASFDNVAGGIVSKSTTFVGQKGSPQPRVCKVGDYGLINWEDLPNPGYRAMAETIRQVKKSCRAAIIASNGPLKDIEQQRTMALAFQEAGADAVEIDFKWSAGLYNNLLYRVTRAVKDALTIPVIAKLSPFVGDIAENARTVEDAGADAITAINTVFPAMRIDVKRRRPAIRTGVGGLSGSPILPVAVALVYQVYKAVKIPILGCGGIVTGEDALQMIMAGAEAVQICTAAMCEGPDAFVRIHNELTTLIDELELGSIEACVGLAHREPLHVPQSPTVDAAAS